MSEVRYHDAAARAGTSMLEYRLPDVGEGLSEAEIVTWRVATGDRVATDEALVEVQTDKSVVEIPSPADGVVVRLGGEEGDIIPVGGLLAVLEVASEAAAPAEVPTSDEAAAPTMAEVTPAEEGQVRRRRVLATPATRRLAVDLGVDLAAVAGSGPGGRVTRQDVDSAAVDAPAPGAPERGMPTASPAAEDRVEPLRGIRRRIAQTMRATVTIPSIAEWRDVEATELLDVHRRLREKVAARGGRLTLLPLILKAVAAALREHPHFNARIDVERGEITYLHRINLGVATATPEGLVVPVVRDVDRAGLGELADEVARLADAARARTLSVEEHSTGTCTVSNFGSFGTTRGMPLIRPPEVAIVGVGRVHDAVVPVDGEPAVRPILPLVVVTDHRLNDGDHLAAFCDTLVAHLADPSLLLVA